MHRIRRETQQESALEQWVYEIDGNIPLTGEAKVQGSKNAVLPMLAASILQTGCVCFRNCPDIEDVRCMLQILQYIGARVRKEGEELYISCEQIEKHEIPAKLAGRMRSSVLLVGALLGRMGEAAMRYPGGCVIGQRPIDLHMEAFRALGSSIWDQEGLIIAKGCGLQGAAYTFPRVSVGATENAILAAVCARGETCLHNCAREPEIGHLCDFLRKMGADIKENGAKICICGKKKLHPCTFTVPADRIAAGTWLIAGAATRGEIALSGAPVSEMQALLELYGKMGGQYEVKSGTLLLHSRKLSNPAALVQTSGYPGFPTDLQSPFLALCATINGKSCIRETIFEDRFRAAAQLRRMGADIRIHGRDATVYGGILTGAEVLAEDLRGGAALVIAGLAAHGHTKVSGIGHLERGYMELCGTIEQLGGRCIRQKAN